MTITPTQALLSAIARDAGGMAIVWCPDLDLRAWLVEETRGLAGPSANPVVVRTVAEALAQPDRLALLVPEDEREVMDDLDGSRDQFLDRTRSQPVVVFLLRDGDGANRLVHLPSLASWVRGSDVDPEKIAVIDVTAERARFEREVGVPPESWLRRWHDGQIARTGEAYARAYWATTLVTTDSAR